MLHKTWLCWAGTEKLTLGIVYKWKSLVSVLPVSLCLSQRSPSVNMKTLPIYLNCVRCCVAKIFLNQRIRPVRVSVYLSILSVHPSLLHAFCSKPNVLETICTRSRTRLPSSQSFTSARSSPIDPCSVYRNHSQDQKKRRWQSKQGGSCCNQRCLLLILQKQEFPNLQRKSPIIHPEMKKVRGDKSYFSTFVSHPLPSLLFPDV